MASHHTMGESASAIYHHIGTKKAMISSEMVIVVAIVALLMIYHLLLNGPVDHWLIIISVVGFGLALMDSSIGMGYGTIGTPLLILLGFSSKFVIPSILVSQLIAAVIASTLHQKRGNVRYFDLKGNDVGIVTRLIAFGLIGTVIGAFLDIHLTKVYLNTYIGLLVIAMGFILLLRSKITFTWAKVNILSMVSGFNKAMSGGGYGPVATTGLLVSGNPLKNSVAATLFSVIFINLTSFVIYVFSGSITSLQLPIFLTIGVLVGSQIGPRMTKRLGESKSAKVLFSFMSLAMGSLTILLTFVG
ncbi:MAG: sulfite exporter TauE/SafE family protein [Thermoplasmatales archaeon]